MHTFEEKALAIDHDRYMQVRRQTENLCAPLHTEDFVPQPIVDVSPPKWHMGHTTWFFETFILSNFMKGYKPFHERYNYIFNSYYESIGERVLRVNRGNLTRPTVDEVRSYRQYVDEQMARLFHLVKDDDVAELEKLLVLGMNHEQQHQELLVTDIKYMLGNNPLFPAYKEDLFRDKGHTHKALALEFLPVSGGLKSIGYEGAGFAWDNEKPAHRVYVADFELANRLVTNGEYMQFMNDGGYTHFNHWLGEGWDRVRNEHMEAPLYWHKINGEWMHYTLGGLQPIDPHVPVTHISFYEADAFASWAGYRLPTEAEWEIAAQQFRPQASDGNFVESGRLHPVAAPADMPGCTQLLGDAWEWTYSGYFPYPGYEREPGALGEYNGKFMINQMVLRGGSCATPENHIRPTYRNFFQTDKQWQYTGIRLAR